MVQDVFSGTRWIELSEAERPFELRRIS